MRNGHRRSVSCWWPLAAALVLGDLSDPVAAADKVRVGGELLVNAFTLGSQTLPNLAIESNGDWVVVWQSSSQDGSAHGLFGRRFDSAGNRKGVEFQVNLYTALSQLSPVVDLDDDGDFVVAWESEEQDGSGLGIFARRFDQNGNALGAELQVNTFTTGAQQSPALAVDSDGDFVVVWQSDAQDGDTQGIFAHRFTSGGNPLAGEFQVNTYTMSHQRLPSVSPRSDGGFVVVWHSYTQDYGGFGVFGRRFDAGGAALAVEFQVNASTFISQFYVDVASGAADDFVVTWETLNGDGDQRAIFLRRFDSSGSAQGGEIQVNTYTTGTQDKSAVAAGLDGSFVVAWRSSAQDGNASGVFAQVFDSLANRVGAEFQVNTRTASNQTEPDVAAAAGGDFIVAWESAGQDGEQYGVFAQRFADASALDIDLDGQIEALTDGLLILRWIFGFTGSTLVTGAVDVANCQRCEAPAIAAHIGSISSQLDIDGDSEVEPLTDGLLVLRWMFGFTGATLITGAVDVGNCTRCTAPAIETYLQGLAG